MRLWSEAGLLYCEGVVLLPGHRNPSTGTEDSSQLLPSAGVFHQGFCESRSELCNGALWRSKSRQGKWVLTESTLA